MEEGGDERGFCCFDKRHRRHATRNKNGGTVEHWTRNNDKLVASRDIVVSRAGRGTGAGVRWSWRWGHEMSFSRLLSLMGGCPVTWGVQDGVQPYMVYSCPSAVDGKGQRSGAVVRFPACRSHGVSAPASVPIPVHPPRCPRTSPLPRRGAPVGPCTAQHPVRAHNHTRCGLS